MRLPSFIAIVILVTLLLMMTGCSTTVPVTSKFPVVPERLMVQCPQLQKLEDDAKLSNVAKTITLNYTTYYECAIKNDAWIEWYNVQKHIYENLK